jgi:hypothetical protein
MPLRLVRFATPTYTLQELARAKDAAVASEDYDEAKRLKASIERLKVGDQQSISVHELKRPAVLFCRSAHMVLQEDAYMVLREDACVHQVSPAVDILFKFLRSRSLADG